MVMACPANSFVAKAAPRGQPNKTGPTRIPANSQTRRLDLTCPLISFSRDKRRTVDDPPYAAPRDVTIGVAQTHGTASDGP
jgi:hypothetical protein